MAESEDSIISELSARADRTKSDALESQEEAPFTEKMPRPLHRTSHAMSSHDFYEELDHIYEELDNVRAKTVETPERSMSESTLKEDGDSEEPEYAVVGIALSETTSESETELPEELYEYKLLIESKPLTGAVRKAHPDGLVFPRITTVVAKLPELPEEAEISSQEGQGIALMELPYVDDSVASFIEVSPSELSYGEEESKTATIRMQTEVRADHCKLMIRGWETLISDSEEGF